uniref:Uncharacterized protein n=1 Tax=viral metagenome TaxID=1070528 RepID=A0A6C0E6U9_9ZZZZ
MSLLDRFINFLNGRCCNNPCIYHNSTTGLKYCRTCRNGYIKTYECYFCHNHHAIKPTIYYEIRTPTEYVKCSYCRRQYLSSLLKIHKTKVDKITLEPVRPVKKIKPINYSACENYSCDW